MDEVSCFYRYIRPVKFDPSRLEVVTQPRGGVCLRFEIYDRADSISMRPFMWFTFARCHDDDLFSKEVAKRIVNGRADNLVELGIPRTQKVGAFAYSNNAKILCREVINFCFTQNIDKNDTPKIQYLQAEMLDLGVALRNMVRSNEIEELKAEQFKAAIAATQTSKRYLNASR